jgi:colanic acid biosynthesis protein WcaH
MSYREIPQDLFETIAGVIPMLFVDLIIRNRAGAVLLVKRNNKPLAGEWWVPGGRMHKQETIIAACIRKAKEEVGVALLDLRPVGFYEDIFMGDDSPFDTPLHAVSIVYEAKMLPGEIVLDDQSSEWKWGELPDRFDYTEFK